MGIIRKILIGFFAAATLLAVWAIGIEPGLVRYRDYDIHLKRWPKELSGFSIVFLTDLHVGSLHNSLGKLNVLVDAVNARKPDLILLGGDYVTEAALAYEHVPAKDIAAVLSRLRARHGVYGVLGNHDHWEDAPRIRTEFEKAGIPILEDEGRKITVGQSNFWLAGISDFNTGKRDIGAALSPVAANRPIIAVTHSPDIFPSLPASVDLTIAGHTHGGQVYLPLLGRLIVPSNYGERYAIGLIEEGGKQLFVSPGIGTSIMPVRFLTPPEVSILHLR